MSVPEADKEVKVSEDAEGSKQAYKATGVEDEDKMLNG
jgi:hypothetical protein